MSIGSKIVKGVLGKLTGDISKKKGALPEQVDEAPKDMSRRGVLTGMAATPLVAGALSEIPINKIIDDIIPTDLTEPIASARKVAAKIPIQELGFKLSSLPQMKKSLIKEQALGMGIELDDVSKLVQRKVESFDDLSEKEIGNVFETYFDAPGSASVEQELYESLADTMSESDLNAFSKKDLKDFIAGSEMLLGDMGNTPGNVGDDAFALFINEMRMSGYNDDEIADLIMRSRDRLEDDLTSLDD